MAKKWNCGIITLLSEDILLHKKISYLFLGLNGTVKVEGLLLLFLLLSGQIKVHLFLSHFLCGCWYLKMEIFSSVWLFSMKALLYENCKSCKIFLDGTCFTIFKSGMKLHFFLLFLGAFQFPVEHIFLYHGK